MWGALRYVIWPVAGFFLVAVGLILSQWPSRPMSDAGGLNFDAVTGIATEMPLADPVDMRDGYDLMVRRFDNGPGPLTILIHGSGWNGLQFAGLAPQLPGTVLVPDLRGHGAAPGRRGDIDYIGQFEDDLADLIIATAKPGQKVVLAGHSSGGGLVVRMAGGPQGHLLDGAVLLAPFLKHNAPSTRKNSGGWAYVMVRRIIGLGLLNRVGITALNGLTVIEFDFPHSVIAGPYGNLATRSYSYRLNTSYAPRAAYTDDIAALPPFLLIAGAQDEAFVAAAYAPLMQAHTPNGSYQIVPGADHLGVVDAPETAGAMIKVLNEL